MGESACFSEVAFTRLETMKARIAQGGLTEKLAKHYPITFQIIHISGVSYKLTNSIMMNQAQYIWSLASVENWSRSIYVQLHSCLYMSFPKFGNDVYT